MIDFIFNLVYLYHMFYFRLPDIVFDIILIECNLYGFAVEIIG